MTDRTSPPRFIHSADAPPDGLTGERVAVLGYGNLGRAAALNLRDSGVSVRVGNREDEYASRARADGFAVVPVGEASCDDVVFVLLPDEVVPEVFAADIAPVLRPGSAIAFASGYTLAYGLIAPPPGVDVLLVAPRMMGEAVRDRFLAGRGFWAYVGVEHDASGRAARRMLGLAAGLGALREGALEMSAAMESTIDLYVEQTLGPLLGAAMLTAFEVGCEAGIQAEALVLEMYMSGEMETVYRSFREAGLFGAAESHGPTALFGGITRMLDIDRDALARRFKEVLDDIRAGRFARRFRDEREAGYPVLKTARDMIHSPSPLAEAEARVRVSGAAPPR